MQPFSLLVKPACGDCNLRCAYCFYLSKRLLYPAAKVHRMDERTLRAMVSSYMATDQQNYAFGWQGGEPALMGVDFFRKAVELQQEYGRGGAVVSNGLQTNATLIDAEFARHLGEYRFLVGVSLDGPPEMHDYYRLSADGRGSHADVMRGIRHLKDHHVEFNILVLVNDVNVRHARQVYRYLRDQGFLYHQYIPCVEFDETGKLLPFAVDGERWGEFLCQIYDEWIKTDTRTVSIRLFDSILMYRVEGIRNVCNMGSDCRQYLVVEHNGDVYPCDFFVEKDLILGNVKTDTWLDMQAHPLYKAFGERKSQWNPACQKCEHLQVCMGDCPKQRLAGTTDPRRLSVLCPGWKKFHSHTTEGFRDLARQIVRDRQDGRMKQARQSVDMPASGRNDPCPCGSGRKYKRCCGAET